MNFNFTPQHLTQNNPFYFVLDHQLKILQFGDSLKKLIPSISVGISFTEFFTILRPNIADDFDSFRTAVNSLFILQIKSHTLQMKGQSLYFANDNCILFLGAPAITTLDQMKNIGLS